MTCIINKIFTRLTVAIAIAALAPAAASAFPTDTYAANSRLSSGYWVKVSVTTSGLYCITNQQLKEWGFSDPSSVRIFGYGGQRISDKLSLANYIDDLPPVPYRQTAAGLVFFANGVETWTHDGSLFNHKINPFTTVGYYFLTTATGAGDRTVIEKSGTAAASSPATTFQDHLYHEVDTYKLGQTGHLLLGEDFKWTPSRTFNFTLTDIVDASAASPVTMKCHFVARTLGGTSSLEFTANGVTLPYSKNDDIAASGSSSHTIAVETTTTKSFEFSNPYLSLGITHSSRVPVEQAFLDFIEINYTRNLRLNGGYLDFTLQQTQASLAGATASTHVWDVTDPLNVTELNTAADSRGVCWTNDYTGMRRYVAWNEGVALPSPAFVEEVANQNLHGTIGTPDMVIFTLDQWRDQAERIATLHRTSAIDPLEVVVVNPAAVYNEFGSGAPDVNTMRRYLKMLYDRGLEADKPLKYCLIMGQPTYDNRRLSPSAQAITYPTLPTWQSERSLDDNISFTTDDIFGLLLDDSFSDNQDVLGSDPLCIAVGRMPIRTYSDAKTAVDKLYDYVNNPRRTPWANRILLVADDENKGKHMTQTEDVQTAMMSTDDGDQFLYNKVYIDAFELKDGTCPDARDRMFQALEEGVLWWSYIGHANPTSWTGEKLLTYYDINNLFINCYPVLYAATCEFLNWDSNSLSGAEILYYTRYGGIIAAITAVRPVYIDSNGVLSRAIGEHTFERDDQGRYLTIGEIYRRGKNSIVDKKGNLLNDKNKLRFVLMGDPAMHLATPKNRVVLEKIGDETVNPDDQVTIMARQQVTLEGYVCDYEGNLLSDFNGDVTVDMYDAEYSTTSLGRGTDGTKVTFEEMGRKLYTGRDAVVGGRFKLKVAMPETIAGNWRPAALNMYAKTSAGLDATGVCRDFYVYGFDESAEPDETAPVITSLYLNHPSFADGATVNPTPMLIATISDDLGFNLSSAGVGHTFSVQVDGAKAFTNVSSYFTPDMGSLSGTINYPMEELSAGHHTVRLRVWDTYGNLAERSVDCFVKPNAQPTIYEVYTDANPATSEARFYLSHDRPDMMMTVKVEVYNLLGQPVWSGTETGRSDMFISMPVTWDLTDAAGRRVNRGIYVYRAIITESDGEQYVTKSSRIAVGAPQ